MSRNGTSLINTIAFIRDGPWYVLGFSNIVQRRGLQSLYVDYRELVDAANKQRHGSVSRSARSFAMRRSMRASLPLVLCHGRGTLKTVVS